jgi:predicted nucleotidyltransferase
VTSLVDKIVRIAESLDSHGVSWAIGGAIALAYATEEPRGTRDVDVNVFDDVELARTTFTALPREVHFGETDIEAARRDGQVRLWWDETPIDMFFSVTTFHDEVGRRCRVVPFAGVSLRILSAEDLAVFKAMFDRPKDWVDIATMVEAGSLDSDVAADRLSGLLGDDERVARLRNGGELR